MKLRITLISLLLACLSSSLHATKAHKPFSVTDFSKGVDTYHAPASLPDGFAQDSLNVLFDDVAPVTKRMGFTVAWSTKAYSFTGLSTYTDQTNTSWQIARSSDQLTASNLAGTVVKISTVSSNDTVGITTAFGAAYFVDQTQGVYFWNGTSTTWVSGSPKGSIITQFHNRLWVTGAAVPSGNQLYGSAYYSGTTWATGLNATDPVQYSIGLQDNFDNVTAAYVYLDTLYLFKHYSIFALYGFDQTNFQISQLTQECGCIDGNSIQTYGGGLKFVSLRGVENFDGYHCTRISDPVKNKVDPAIQTGGFSQQSYFLANQSDWQAGTFSSTNSLSATLLAPSLIIASNTFTDNSATFNQGTFNSTQNSSLGIVISTNTNDPLDGSFEAGTNWTFSGGAFRQSGTFVSDHCSLSPVSGSFQAIDELSTTMTVAIVTCDDGSVVDSKSLAFTSSNCSGSGSTLVGNSAYARRRSKIRVSNDGSGNAEIVSDCFIYNGGTVSFWTKTDTFGGSTHVYAFDIFTGGRSSISSGTFMSAPFDMVTSSSYVGIQSLSVTANTPNPTFSVQHATSLSGPWANLEFSSMTYNLANRYVRYISTLSFSGSDNEVTSVSTVSLVSVPSTGTFRSSPHSMSGATSFGNFNVNQTLNGGNIVYSVCTSTAAVGTLTCAAQATNAQITVATNTFFVFYATFSITASTQTPALNSALVQWFSGSKVPPMASTVWDNRYWLSLTTTTADTANDAVLVLNSRGAWATFDIHAGGFTQYKGSLYHADSTGTGSVYLDNQGYADNGRAINAYLRTKDLSLGGLSYEDYLYSVYPESTNTGSCTMTVQYDMDHTGVNMSLGSPLLSEFSNLAAVRLPFPVDTTHQDFGQSINFTVGTNDAVCAWNFYGLEGLFKSRPLQ